MPKRTNEFQELVSLIQRALVPLGATVTDSALLDVPGMDGPREIDVLIESAVGPYHIKIAVEAKDQGRIMDSTQFESIVGKYLLEGGVKVAKVVIVTHKGFYKPVRERAKQLDVELLTLKEAKDAEWVRISAFHYPFKTNPRLFDIQINPPIKGQTDEIVHREGCVVCSHGTNFGSPQQFVAHLFVNNVMRHQIQMLQDLDDDAVQKPEGRKARIDFRPTHPHVIRLNGDEFPLEALVFYVHFSKSNEVQQSTPLQLNFRVGAHVCRVALDPPIDGASNKELASEGRIVCHCCGKAHYAIKDWAQRLVMKLALPRHPDLLNELHGAADDSPNGQARIGMTFTPNEEEMVHFRGKDYPVSTIQVELHAISAKAPLQCRHYELESSDGEEKLFSHYHATAGGKKLSFVVPRMQSGCPEKIFLKVESEKR